jgi:hypothetical protein
MIVKGGGGIENSRNHAGRVKRLWKVRNKGLTKDKITFCGGGKGLLYGI